MRKYWTLFAISWQNGLVYRTSVLIWRFRQLLTTVMALTVWQALMSGRGQVLGYTETEMTSYILVVAWLQSLILASAWHGLAGTIYSGEISNYLIKPVKVWAYLGAVELADKLKNVGFSLCEIVLLWAVLRPTITWPPIEILGLFALWALLGTAIHFYITLLFGWMGFYAPETWGPKFLFFMIVDVTAGKMFPLDILPQALQTAVWLTPFPYLSYAQTQLFLGRLSSQEMWLLTVSLMGWTIGLWALAHWGWQRGVRSFEGTGQ
jgi:ABC-2 type transport system permease protein